jgi:AcrR family transcriptional regulator
MAITRADILETTLQIAESEGLDAVSMRAVARRLEVTPMALYNHVGGKQALLDGLVERLLDDIPVPDPRLPWQQRLRSLGTSMRQTARRHPDAFLMLLRRPATTPASKKRRELVYEALRDAGVPSDDIPRVERLLSTFMLGFAASEAGGRFAEHDTATLDADLQWAEDLVLRAAR